MSPEAFNDISTPRCDASARKSSATPPIYTQWMPVEDGRKLERELAVCERKLKVAVAALTTMLDNQPAQDGGGGLFFPRFDGEGNEIGQEQIDPLAVYGGAMTCAANALAALDQIEKTTKETFSPSCEGVTKKG